MSTTSKTNYPAVPDEPYYPINRLWLFDRHDRASWERAFGEQAPPWDDSRAPKWWADPSVLEGCDDPDNTFVEYEYFDRTTRKFEKHRLSVTEAATPNIPGEYTYPDYVIEATPAVVVNPDGGEGPLNPEFLSYRAEAEELMRELNGDSIVQNSLSKFQIEWRGEHRRMWLVRVGGRLFNAGLLLRRKYRNGVGAPGHWADVGGQPTWIAEKQKTGQDSPRRELGVPCRPLSANEKIQMSPFGDVIVYRTDKESEFNKKDDGSGFPVELRAMLERIDANLQQLLALYMAGH